MRHDCTELVVKTGCLASNIEVEGKLNNLTMMYKDETSRSDKVRVARMEPE